MIRRSFPSSPFSKATVLSTITFVPSAAEEEKKARPDLRSIPPPQVRPAALS
jgi:hypothetical protein